MTPNPRAQEYQKLMTTKGWKAIKAKYTKPVPIEEEWVESQIRKEEGI